MTLYDLCKSHQFFIKDKRIWFGGKTCEEMDAKFREFLAASKQSRNS
eukprot:CAMPEP_0119019638 /NCGR_PEP_ID=MMETSP1176-20130426/22347_1 /TAXON_ID=265551 /ORGANISM="Synedropsis recta cf, Strain CCMP1620" /LENGTH=46 /DNA_ID= /DNA_START= /DNA_END= /DNA_ORIENTATION=